MQLSKSVSPTAPKSLVNFQTFQKKECAITCQVLWKQSASSGRKAPSFGETPISNSTSSPSQHRLATPQDITRFSKTTSPLNAAIICFHASSLYSAEWPWGHLVILGSLTSPEDIRIPYYMQFLAHTEWQHSSTSDEHFLILLPFWCHTFLGLAHLRVTLT